MNHFAVLILPLCLMCSVFAVPGTDESKVDYGRDVKPILAAHCYRCHGSEKQSGGLRLDRRTEALAGGDSGAAIVPGNTAKSLLLDRVASDDKNTMMPPKGERLNASEIKTLRTWIGQGAQWPDDGSTALAKDWWSFKSISKPTPPKTANANVLISNDVDRFILARLNDKGLTFSKPADRRTLIRRIHYDLIGLPPSPEAIEAFVNDTSVDAYETLVSKLLASPQYGERWARHWLDVVRFAESNGFETNQPRPNAWHYRDYVIQSMNDDKPYDQFVREQLAGDSLNADVATGFLVAGPWDAVKSPDPMLTAQQRADELHDIVSTTSSTFLGLTVGCARCHQHKFDPISQADYYAIKAVFAGVQHGERPIRGLKLEYAPADALARKPEGRPGPMLRPPVHTGVNIDRFTPVTTSYLRFTVRATNSGNQPCLDELEVFEASDLTRNLAAAATMSVSSSYPNNPIHRLEHLNDGRYGNSHSWISNETGRGWVVVQFPKPVRIDRVIWSRDRTEPPRYRDRIPTDYTIEISDDGKSWSAVASSADRARNTPNVAYIGRLGPPEETFRFHRGEVMQPKEKVNPGVLSALRLDTAIPADATDAQRRLGFARWVTNPSHPLTARVIVNRLWQYHFGTGLVETTSDFGRNGASPSHPELLDWLARELVEKKWSLKHIHRLIVTSATYRQSSESNARALSIDASTRLLWRYPPQRLEAECLRDAILAVSGKLDSKPGGPGFDLFEPNTNYVKVYMPKSKFGPETFRRMIYQSKPRMQLDDTFGVFDCPDAGQITPKRSRSITPLQALNLLNSPFLIQQADNFAERLKADAGVEPAQQVRRGFELAFGRPPTDGELQAALELIRVHGLAAMCRALFNANEFVFIR